MKDWLNPLALLKTSLLWKAGLRWLQFHPWQLALALLGISLGVAVVVAVDLANTGAAKAFSLSAEAITGKATHRLVGGPNGIPERTYRALRLLPNAPPSAPMIRGRARFESTIGKQQSIPITVLGIDPIRDGVFREGMGWDTSADLGKLIAGGNTLLLPAATESLLGLNRPSQLSLRFGDKDLNFQVVGRVGDADDSDNNLGMEGIVIMDIATAQAVLQRKGVIDRIDLILGPDQERLIYAQLPPAARLGIRLIRASEDDASIARLSESFRLNLTAMSLLALLVGAFLIFNAMNFSVLQRRSLLGRLRAVGVTSDEIFRLILTEAFILGVVGTAFGIALGILLGNGLVKLVAQTVNDLYFAVNVTRLDLDIWSLIKGIGLGLVTTLAAAWFPARSASRMPAVTTLSRISVEDSANRAIPLAAAMGAGIILFGLLCAFVLPGGVIMGFAGLFLICVGAAALTPGLLMLFAYVMEITSPGRASRMMLRELRRNASRLSISTAALMVALSSTVGVGIMVSSFKGAVSEWLDDLLAAEVYVSPLGESRQRPLDERVLELLKAHPGVASVSTYRHIKTEVQGRTVSLIAARPEPRLRAGYNILAGDPEKVWDGFADQGHVLISEPLATHTGLGPGDRLSLKTPYGPRDFPINGVFRDYGSEHGRILMHGDRYARLWNDPSVHSAALFSKDTWTADRLISELGPYLADAQDLELSPGESIRRHSLDIFDRTFAITQVLRILAVGVAFIGVLSALMALQFERGREYAVLRAVGLTRLELGQHIFGQTVILAMLAGIIAVPTGLTMSMVLIESVQYRAFGWSMPFIADDAVIAQALTVALMAGVLAGALPAWQAGRANPSRALREE